MKYLHTLCVLLLLTSLFTHPALAITVTTAPSPSLAPTEAASEEAELETIQKIKKMVADKVSKLRLIEKRGILGTVKEVSTTQITITTDDKRQQFIEIDDLTKFQESIGSSKTFGISDIEKGDRLGFIGNYNKDTRRLLARFVIKTSSIPTTLEGGVLEINRRAFSFVMITDTGERRSIDVESSTKTKLYGTDTGEQKSGFSKIEPGQRIIVTGFSDTEDEEILNASRILHFTDLPVPANVREILNKEIDVEQITPSITPKATPPKSTR